MQQVRPGGYRCVIVTSDYHCPRVAVLARRNGLSATVVGATTPGARWIQGAARDFAAFVITCWKSVAVLGVVVALAAVLVI